MRRNAARFLLGIIVANCVCCLHVFADNSAPDSVATGEWSNKYFVDFDNDWSKPVDSDRNATKSNTKLITTVEGARDTTTGAGYVKRAGLGIGDGLTVSNGQLLIDTSAIGDSIGGNAVTYTPGNNVQISTNNEISATDTKYQSGNATNVTNNGPIDVQNNASKGVKVESNKLIVGIDNETIKFDSNGNLTAVCPDNSGTGCAVCEVCEECEQCQTCQECTEYTAGENVQISATGEISATDTKYTAGTNINIDENNKISATNTTYQAGDGISISNGTNKISANIDGTTIKTNSNGKLYAVAGAELYKAGTNITIDANYRISAPSILAKNGLEAGTVNNTVTISVRPRQNSGLAISEDDELYIKVDGASICFDQDGNLTTIGCSGT